MRIRYANFHTKRLNFDSILSNSALFVAILFRRLILREDGYHPQPGESQIAGNDRLELLQGADYDVEVSSPFRCLLPCLLAGTLAAALIGCLELDAEGPVASVTFQEDKVGYSGGYPLGFHDARFNAAAAPAVWNRKENLFPLRELRPKPGDAGPLDIAFLVLGFLWLATGLALAFLLLGQETLICVQGKGVIWFYFLSFYIRYIF